MVPPAGAGEACAAAWAREAARGGCCCAWINDDASAARQTINAVLRPTSRLSCRSTTCLSGSRMSGSFIQQPDYLLITLGTRDGQRGIAALALSLHVRTGAHQQFDHVGAAVGGGEHQRGDAG